MSDWLEGQVVERRVWNPEHFSLRISAAIEPFEAGQFVRVALDIDGERVGRPYSLVNPPADPILEIFFNIVPGGPLSPHLAELGPGDPIFVAPRANGFLTLSEVPEHARDLWLLATGTAIGPYLSMLQTTAPWRRFERIVLIQAVRYNADLAYRNETETLVAEHGDRLTYIPFVSREENELALAGRIPAAIEDGRLETRADLRFDPKRSHVMLCGNNGMIQDTLKILEARGLKRHRRRDPGQVTMEKYH